MKPIVTRNPRHFLFSILALAYGAVSADADTAANPQGLPPPVFLSTDNNGVELSSGRFTVSHVALPHMSIGSADSGMSYRFVDANMNSNFNGYITQQTCDTTRYSIPYQVTYGEHSAVFYSHNTGSPYCLTSGPYTIDIANGAQTFASNSSGYLYTLSDGTAIQYTLQTSGSMTNYMVSTVTKPDGEVLSYTYSGFNVIAVTSNTGYMLKRETSSGRVSLVNLDVDYCAPTATSCSYSRAWPSLTYVNADSTGNTPNMRITDALSRTTQFFGWNGTAPMWIVTPNGNRTDITLGTSSSNCGVNLGRVTAVTKGGNTWTYSYAWDCKANPDLVSARTLTTTATSPLGNKTVATTFMSSGQLSSITDVDGNKTTFSSNLVGEITNATLPEGNAHSYGYDSRNNYVSNTQSPKSGGSGSYTESLVFPSNCTNPITCNRPTAHIDANGNETDYTYDATHGGVLTETGPANASGIRSQVRYSYTQLSARYQSAAGTWISGAPIWKLTSTSTCKTQASCTGTDDEVVTTYTYNDNLLPVTQTVSSGNGTVYSVVTKTYDDVGNVTTVDGPLPGSVDTTYYFYDAMRQAIGEIDPSADGSKPRIAIRTTYSLDGLPTVIETGTASGTTLSDLNAMTVCKRTNNSYDSLDRLVQKTDTSLSCN